MNILLSVHEGDLKNKYFPRHIIDGLSKLGKVTQNLKTEPWTEEELSKNIRGMDICITHWGSPQITEEVLKNADKLRLIAHCAGSVFNFIVPQVYEKGITVVGANKVMAKAVAECTLALILASILKLSKFTGITKSGGWKKGFTHYGDMKSLHKKNVLLVGFGDIGRYVYDLLVPFNTALSVYDPFLKSEIKAAYGNINFVSDLDAAIITSDVISLHASQNPDSKKLFGKDRIDSMKDGALLVNTARGSIVDEAHLTKILKSGRIFAALDVFEEEPLSPDSELRNLPNVICMPHVAGSSVVTEYAETMTIEINNFMNGLPLYYEITAEKAGMMTRE